MTPPVLPLSAIVELPHEISGALTFHLPLELFALEEAGASPEWIAEVARRGLAEAFGDGLVDPPFYRWAVEHYRSAAERLLDDDPAVRLAAFAEVEPIGEGLAGAAFHGVIRTGYAVMRRDAAELARGLGYLRSRRQVLGGPSGGPDATASSFPDLTGLRGSTVYDQLNLAAAAGGPDTLCDPGRPLASAADFAARAGSLITHAPTSFVSIHAMTGLHGLCEVHRLVTASAPSGDLDASPLAGWWRAYAAGLRACTVVVGHVPDAGRPVCAVDHADIAALTAAAIASGDTHSVKLVVAMRSLHEMGLLDEDDVLQIGSWKLGADECRAG